MSNNLSANVVVALVQMDIEPGHSAQNARRAAEWIATAARSGAQVVVLPELWSSGYALGRATELADTLGEGAFATMQQLAVKHGVWLAGSLLESEGPHVYNTLAVYDPAGRRIASYRKTHLFGLMDEPQHLRAGDLPVMAELPFGRTGLAVCYDLRFPQLFVAYADSRFEALLICAEWPNPRLDHWRTLLRARAIEHQVFVIAANRVGGSTTTFFGHSMIIDPWGEIVVEGDDAEGVVTGRVDRARVKEVRTHFPFLSDGRRFERMTAAEDRQRGVRQTSKGILES